MSQLANESALDLLLSQFYGLSIAAITIHIVTLKVIKFWFGLSHKNHSLTLQYFLTFCFILNIFFVADDNKSISDVLSAF